MNEIAAIVYLVLFYEQALDDVKDENLRILNDPNHLEPDAYCLFAVIMNCGIMELFDCPDPRNYSKL